MSGPETIRYVGVAGVAAWFGVSSQTVSKWLIRYAPTHPCPTPDAEIEGIKGWLAEREPEWRAWDKARLGQGAAGVSKPRKS